MDMDFVTTAIAGFTKTLLFLFMYFSMAAGFCGYELAFAKMGDNRYGF